MISGEKLHFYEVLCKGFLDKITLANLHRMSTSKKHYDCTVNKRRFLIEDYVNNHQYIHTSEKPHAFKMHYERFSQKYVLISSDILSPKALY